MRRIYLIRHGKPDFPGGKRMCLGRTDLPLCEEGFRQARDAAQQLEGKSFRLYVSPLIRAVQTAQALERPMEIVEDFQELYAGKWDGLDFDTIRVRYPELYVARAGDKTIPLPDAESNADGFRRFTTALQSVLDSCGEDLAIVGHGGIFSLFLQKATGTWYKPGYGEIVTLYYDNGIFGKEEN